MDRFPQEIWIITPHRNEIAEWAAANLPDPIVDRGERAIIVTITNDIDLTLLTLRCA